MTTETTQPTFPSKEEMDNFWESLDLTPVNDYFGEILGLKVALKKIRREGRGGQVCYSLKDETNIAPMNPITNGAWKNMTLGTFGSWVSMDEKGEMTYAGNIHIQYEHHSGGSNGASIGKARFAGGKWDIIADCKK